MKPKELFSKISRVESLLNEFSFTELNSDLVVALKQALENFMFHFQDVVTPKSLIGDSKFAHSPSTDKTNGSYASDGVLMGKVGDELAISLNSLLDIADSLKKDIPGKTRLERLASLQSAAHSLVSGINELLGYSKLSGGLEQVETIDFNLCRVVRDVVYICKTLIVQKSVSLKLFIDSAIPEVLVGDPSKLSQVLLNILGNTIEFVNEGQIHLNVVLKKQIKDNLYIEFTISGNRIGIVEDYGGTHLGVSIVKQIITHLNGNVSVAGSLDKGTIFKCCLPYGKGNKGNIRKKDTAREYHLAAAKFIKGYRILVFEDNPINQRLIVQLLKKWGCAVFIAESSTNGLGLLEEQDIDVVLTDLRMPGMSGFEIATCIRKHKSQAIRQLPIIALTADFAIQDKEKSEMCGINDYLLKPYSPDELLLKLIASKKTVEPKSNLPMPVTTTFSTKIQQPAVFSLDPIFKDCMENMELVEELIRLYNQNALEFIGESKFQLIQKDFDALDFSLHKMKSGLTMMQTNELLAIVEQMQNCCNSDRDIKHLNFLYECFVSEYSVTQLKIDRELKTLKKK